MSPARLAQVDGGDLVVAAAGGVGVHVLPVGRHNRQQHQHDGQAHPGRERHRRNTGQGQGQQDFIRRIRHRGQCVGGKNRQRDAFGQQRMGELVVAEGTPHKDSLERVEEVQHAGNASTTRAAGPMSRPAPWHTRS